VPVASHSVSVAITASEADVASRTRHKIAVRLLPFLFIIYIANYLDRTSVGYATLRMSRDLRFSDRVFGLGAGTFFISYAILQIPGALLVERWSARRCITLLMITWGLLTVLTAMVHNPIQLYTARFLLGAAEAGFFPGVIAYLGHWFIREDRAKAGSIFLAAIPLSFIMGSPLAGWTLGQHWFGLDGWRWLFVLEGAPAVLLGIIAYFYLTDRPDQAKWLAPEQREWIERKLCEEKAAKPKPLSVWQTLRSREILLLAAVVFMAYMLFYTFVFWWPTILKRLSGFTDTRVGLFGALPYVAALIAMLISGWHSDKTQERRWHVAVPLFIGAAALLFMVVLPGSPLLAISLFTLFCLMQAFLPPIWVMPTEVFGESSAAAGIGMINAVASIAGFVGPYLFGYLYSRTGSFTPALSLLMVCGVVGGLLVLQAPTARQRSEARQSNL